MVHRPADSRLLTNLLAQEKDYSKHLTVLLDRSEASLASFSAYASASSPPTSQVILSVAGSFAGADEAFRRYAASVDEWREHLKSLKSLEDDVGNIMRDREILVTRLIKASKSHKPNRESLLLNQQQFPSSSTLSLKSDFSGLLPASAKLTAAQSELQACETHLATKERELAVKRSVAVREGLSIRCRALVECGWAWGEMGKEGLRALEALGDISRTTHFPSTSENTHYPTQTDPTANGDGTQKPLPHPNHPSSDHSSLSPSQSASQINLTPNANNNNNSNSNSGPNSNPSPNINTSDLAQLHYPESSTHIYSDANYTGYGSSSQHSHSLSHSHSFITPQPQQHLQAYSNNTNSNGQTAAQMQMQIPPAHAISELALPTSTAPTNGAPNKRHVLARRITEEDLLDQGPGSSEEEEDAQAAAGREVKVVENPRFAAGASSRTSFTGDRERDRSGLGLGFGKRFARGGMPASSANDGGAGQGMVRERRESTSSSAASGPGHARFFGSLRGLFGHGQRKGVPSPGSASWSGDSRDGGNGGSGRFGMLGIGKKGKWETRTGGNLKKLEKEGDSDEDGVRVRGGGDKNVTAFPPFVPSTSTLTPRTRVASDAAVGNAASPGQGRRLKKGKSVQRKNTRSSSVPPGAVSKKPSEVPGGGAGGGVQQVGEDGVRRAEAWIGGQGLFVEQEREREAGMVAEGGGLVKGKGRGGRVDGDQPGRRDGERGWASDGEATPAAIGARSATGPAGSETKKKKKNKGQGKEKPTTATSALSGSNLSRNSSLLSAASAPPAFGPKSHTKRASSVSGALQTMDQTPSASVLVTRRAAVGDDGHKAAGLGSDKVGRRASAPVHAGGETGQGGMSLMSIVEGVSRGNREAWSNSEKMKSAGGTVLPVAMLEVVKAPPSVGRKELLAASAVPPAAAARGRGGSAGGGFEVPTAPRSVFDILPTAERREAGGGTLQASTSAPAGTFKFEGSGRRPAVSPLRSALRNTSRTPSPLPASRSLPATSPSPHLPPPVSSTLPILGHDLKGERAGEEDDDGASVSSYETGHEVFEQEGDERTEHAPPPPLHERENIYGSPPAQEFNGTSMPMRQSHAGGGRGQPPADGSDVSASTMSTDARHSGPPRRRKSVRVSLQPTFSATPPAIDDEDAGATHAPWGGLARSASGGGDGVRDLWEDSSEEDLEYSKARKLLSRAGRKEKQK